MKHHYWVLVLLFAAGCSAPSPETLPDVPSPTAAASESHTDPDKALYERLSTVDIPDFVMADVAVSMLGADPDSIPDPPSTPTHDYTVGDSEQFWVFNFGTGEFTQTEADLVYISEHAYFWVDRRSEPLNAAGRPMSAADWRKAGGSFDDAYAAVRAVFGEENSPGIDGDPRLHILHSDTSQMGRIYGYYSELDTRPEVIQPFSNEHEMFFAAIDRMGGINGQSYIPTLAHEFQHAIHFNIDRDEDLWLNEALSKMAELIATGGHDPRLSTYTDEPNQSLWYWGGTVGDYIHGFLFIDYLAERFGKDFLTRLTASPANGLTSIDEVLKMDGSGTDADTIFGDFMAALFLDDPAVSGGQYAFRDVDVGRVALAGSFDSLPVDYDGEVHQYGIDAIRLTGDGPVNLSFTGAQTVQLVPTQPHNGEQMWWSNRGDMVFSTLTREVDLREVGSATLNYWTWFHLEEAFDFAYVLVSTDGGKTWATQASSSSRTADGRTPNYGSGLTGMSGEGSEPAWVQETVDLSAYAGQVILLRFASITDTGMNEAGMVIDEIEIPEIGFFDDAESGDNSWTADGFVRMHNQVPQKWMLRVVLAAPHARSSEVLPFEIREGRGSMVIDLGAWQEVLILITGQTRFTDLPAAYQLTVEPAQ